LARRDAAGFEPYAKQIAKLFQNDPQVLEDLIHGLFHIAKADNVIHPAEMIFLQSVAEIFGFDETDFYRFRAHHVAADAKDPYAILGVEYDASDEDIKRTYRQLIRENHPDRAIAQGLPQEFIDLATEKLSNINNAYENIQSQRGLN
jgi:DnaJ like chaperone protein